MLLEIFFVIFFFFTCEQIFAGFHFTGRSKLIAIFLVLIGFFNLYKSIIFLFHIFLSDSLLHTFILLVISFAVITIVNAILEAKAKIKIHQAGKGKFDAPVFADIHLHYRNVMITVTALLGVLVNFALLLIFH